LIKNSYDITYKIRYSYYEYQKLLTYTLIYVLATDPVLMQVTIKHNNAVILQGHHTAVTKLWELYIQPAATPTTHKANAAMGSATPAELVAFAHTALFSPALSTLAKALRRRHLPEFAGLTLQ